MVDVTDSTAPEYYPMPAFPTLSVRDLEASARFYVEGLGFQHVFTIPGPDGMPILVHIRFARYADLLLEPEAAAAAPGERGWGVRLTFSLPLAELSATELAGRADRLGVFVEGPVERPWNVRDVVVRDADGYVLVFTEPVDVSKSFDEVLAGVAAGR